VSYDTLLDELWKDEDAIYTGIIQHIYKFRRDILDKIGNNITNKEKVKSEQSKELFGFFIFKLIFNKNKLKTNQKQIKNKL